ncbi:MAG: electron transfer flavoprotein subunit alpha/FixB family protein [Calditrichaeota bacterium]|nr:electron transfer flavoprotein subunit alpha/FixB family protein [Calditrichota bacterium]
MMSKILVVAEQRDNQIKAISYEVATLAKQLSDDVSVLVIGSAISDAAKQFSAYGISDIHVVEKAEFLNYSYQVYTSLITQLVKSNSYDAVMIGATAMGKEVAAHVGAALKAGVAQDCTAVNSDLTAVRPVFAGKAISTVQINTAQKVFSIRANSVKAEEKAVEGKIVTENAGIDYSIIVKEILTSASKKLDVAEANIIVTGGRGMGGPENWHLIEDLAETLGAATGASRAVVDAGWRPHSEQVGQTGKVVSPQIYCACGVSGAIQHLAGMKTSKYIVAINKDPEAPIFKVADYGIVGDVFDILPKLNTELKKVLSK